MGCGAAFFDYDNDGWLDIFLVNGSSFDPQARDAQPDQLSVPQQRDGTFTDVTAKAGLTHSGWGQACCVGDYDNDGFDDLFVTYWGRNVLYHNNGDGTFTDVSEKAGVAGAPTRWGAGCCFLDYDRDGHLDLFVANYVNFDPAKAPRPGQSAYCRYNDIPVPCGPQGFAGGTNVLYRNRGDGTFADVSEPSGIARPARPVVDGVRRQQLAADRLVRDGRGGGRLRQRRLARHLRRVRQRAEPALSQQPRRHVSRDRRAGRRAFDENGVALSGMGVGVGDYDGDGWLDIVRTNFSEQVTTLYRNYGGGFGDASLRAGLGVNRKYVGFGVGFFDFDNDGWKDIFIANGHVYSQLADRKLHLTYRQPKVLYRNLGNGRFEDVSAKAGAAIRVAESRARLRVRRLRQRRRRRHRRQQSRRPADAAAQRRRRTRQPLDPDQVRRHALEPVGDRRRA